jgi:hypothetical protein
LLSAGRTLRRTQLGAALLVCALISLPRVASAQLVQDGGPPYTTAVGELAAHNTTGSSNSALGYYSLFTNTSGYWNTASGYGALYWNSNGYQNTASGFEALFSNNGGYNNTASGVYALFTNSSGIANTANGASALQSNYYGSYNMASGFQALLNNTTGNFNTAAGYSALRTNTTGTLNTAIGIEADVASGGLTNATAIGAGAIVNASNKIRLGNSQVTVVEGPVGYTFTSDRNRKENFEPVDGEQVLGKISGLNLTSWNYIGQDVQHYRHYGPMAQDFFAAFGHDTVGTVGTPTTINSADLDGVLLSAVQALVARSEALASRTEALSVETANLRAEKEQLAEAVEALKVNNAALQVQLQTLEKGNFVVAKAR